MFANRYLGRWRAAGLIDDAAAERIAAWEQAQARPIWLWALAGLGAFAVGMGVLAVVAANWERIPGWFKISVDLSLTAALATATFVAWQRGWDKTREILALLLFGLVLSGIALISQVYQLDGEAWQAMLVWLAVCTPFLALVTRSQVLGIAWAVAAAATYMMAIERLERVWSRLLSGEAIILLAWLPGLVLLAIGVARGWQESQRNQANAIIACGLLALLVAAGIPQLIVFQPRQTAGVGVAIVVSLAVAALLWRERARGVAGAQVLMLIVLAGLGLWMATMAIWWLAGTDDATFWRRRSANGLPHIAAALVFITFWAVVSWLALRAGRRTLFVLAFAIIAIRVFIFYWEALGGLLNTGLGLIGGGVLCLVLAALGWRLAQRGGTRLEAAI